MEFRSGFVGLVGPTNSGKSTLLNALIGEKVSIVSPRAQTTYHTVRGILNVPSAQIVFTDTPGFQRHSEQVARLLNRVAERHAKECDALAWVLDASNPGIFGQILRLKEKVAEFKTPEANLCLLNKVDKVQKEILLPLIAQIAELGVFAEIIPISAKQKDGLERIVQSLIPRLSPGNPLYPEDMVTDRSAQFLVSEFVREKIYGFTKQEIPYSARVEIEGWEEPGVEDEAGNKRKCPTIRAIIHVDADSKKGMLIGKGGHMLKDIGSAARRDIEESLGHQVCLKLYVDVEKEWQRDSRVLQQYLELQ